MASPSIRGRRLGRASRNHKMWVIPRGITHIVNSTSASEVDASGLYSDSRRSVPAARTRSTVTLCGGTLASHVTKLLYVTGLIGHTCTVRQFPF